MADETPAAGASGVLVQHYGDFRTSVHGAPTGYEIHGELIVDVWYPIVNCIIHGKQDVVAPEDAALLAARLAEVKA